MRFIAHCHPPDTRQQSGMARVALANVTKEFPSANGGRFAAVNRISFTVETGELLTLVGPSGCGKTTTLRLIAGLETPNAGTISINDLVVNNVEPKARDVAMVFQRDALFPHLTAYENLAFGLRLRGVATEEISQRVRAHAATLGISDCLSRKPGELSGGQRQRIALGRALVRHPKILLLDEPFANLDAPLRRELRHELLRLHREHQLTMILVTHDQAEALALGQRVAVMNHGTLEQIATAAELRKSPATKFVAEFLNPDVI
jgi:multiple sugar transport system ATP-binding protein